MMILSVTFSTAQSAAQKTPPPKPVAPPTGLEIISNGNEPELRVDGVPFFVHAAQFDYFRIPADLWFRSLDRYRELGINTIDLRIPWNWHEIGDAEFDFDGHTNPRRNLRGLLGLIAEKHFRLIARPGPLIGDHWRNAGYPAWLLKYSAYKMDESAIEAGLAPIDAEVAARDGDSAARDWLANEIHMTYARRWMTAIARELMPFNSRNTVQITEPAEREGEKQVDVNGPLLFVVLEDAVAIRTGSDTTELSRYLSELRRGLERGGLDAASLMIVPDIAAHGVPSLFTTIATEDPKPVGLTGEWFFKPSTAAPGAGRTGNSSFELRDRARLTKRDASSLSFLANSLSRQSDFPPLLSNLATTTFAPADDIRAPQPPSENMLLASRLLLGSGLRGFTYTPLQDTLTPAGWGTQSAARYFRWDAALDLAGNSAPHTIAITRNGQLISAWGAMLASSHARADFGIVDPGTSLGAAPTGETTISRLSQTIEQLVRVSRLAGYTPELLNPAAQSVERLLRNNVILLPVPEGNGNFSLSKKAQTVLVEFVRRGGVLIYFPVRPSGSLFEPLWKAGPTESAAREGRVDWPFERGRVIASSNDFYSWVSLTEDLEQNREQSESSAAIEGLASLLVKAGAPRSIQRSGAGKINPELFVSQLVSNQDSASSARPSVCVEEQLCAAGLVSITNLSADQSAEESFEIMDPRAPAAGVAKATIPLDITIPAHESLLLPIHAPLCSAVVEERCTDEVISSGAELLGAERDGKTLELTFYAPARATVRLRLESQPTKVDLGEDFRLENQWKQETGELEFSLLRGAAPDYRRVVRVHLHYTPHVVEKSDPGKKHRQASEYDVFDSIRLALASDASIPTGPPLILAGPSGGQFTMTSWNRTDNLHSVDFNLDGDFHGSVGGRAFPGEQMFTRLRFQPTHNSGTADATSGGNGLLQGELTLRSGRERGSVPILFVSANEAGNTHYQYDFDRDGELEWVLESDRLRIIVSPADAGRALALVDKSTNDDLITLGGAFHDFLAPEATVPAAIPASADFAFNRAYRAAWVEEKQGTGLQLDFSEHENSRAGLHVEKTLHLTAPETVEASYRVSLVTAPIAPANNPGPKQSFISSLSVPATASEGVTTRFCWRADNSPASPAISAPAKSAPAMHCEDFVPSGKPIVIPPEVTRLEVQTSGRSMLTVEWTGVHATIVPKQFSAQVEFILPAPIPGTAPSEFTLRYTVGELSR
ncbi:MAG: exo-beta-D-glucosaminidase [Candidatus Acidoferrum typicum]|nr:exo-beta-D-glucosaminidase [Candidatus Acidoferrum typicum]